jgi:Rrf2 family nitric oxide-sensitive transcriptional repressor
MRLQKNTLFALYSVLESASQPARQLSAGEIARKYGISPHHLAKVLHTLARAGVVESVRGVGGGYRFAGNARRLTLMDVIELFENIGAPGRSGPARRRASAGVERAVGTVLSEIDAMAGATLHSISIATMLKLIERQRSGGAGSY